MKLVMNATLAFFPSLLIGSGFFSSTLTQLYADEYASGNYADCRAIIREGGKIDYNSIDSKTLTEWAKRKVDSRMLLVFCNEYRGQRVALYLTLEGNIVLAYESIDPKGPYKTIPWRIEVDGQPLKLDTPFPHCSVFTRFEFIGNPNRPEAIPDMALRIDGDLFRVPGDLAKPIRFIIGDKTHQAFDVEIDRLGLIKSAIGPQRKRQKNKGAD